MTKDLVLTVRVHEAALRETGDADGRAGENVVNVALLWPRPGQDEVMGTTGLVALRDHSSDADPIDRPPLFQAPVLKEKVWGDVALLVHVLERDRTGAVVRFLRRLAGAAMEGASRGLGAGIIRHAFSEAAEEGGIMLGDSPDDRLDAVAVSEEPLLLSHGDLEQLAASSAPRIVRVPLIVPRQLDHPREKGRIAPLRSNGWLALDLRVDGS